MGRGIEWEVFGGGSSCHRRSVLQPDIAIASEVCEVPDSSKN